MGAVEHVDIDPRDGTEAAALDQHRALAQHLRGLQHFPGGPNMARAAQTQLHQLEAHHAVIDVAELDAGELDHVDFDAVGAQVVEQRFEHPFRLVMQETGGVEQVHADDPERLLLQTVFVIEHPDVDQDLAVFIARVSLIFDAHPAVALVGALVIARRDGVGEDEEGGGVAARGAQPFEIEAVLVVEHALQAFARDVALAAAVDGVADRHVVSGYGFGNGAGRRADLEKPARDLLSGADFGERAVANRIEVDPERFLVRAQFDSFVGNLFHRVPHELIGRPL